MKGKGVLVLVLAIGAGLAYAIAGGKKFLWQGQIQFWKNSEAPALRAFLAKVHLQETPTPRMWRVMPGVPAGKTNALADIKAMRIRASQVASTVNLLDSGNQPRTIGEITIEEFLTLSTGPEVAILPSAVW